MGSGDFTDGGGDPTTRHWYRDRQRFCRQTLSPYEMGLYDHPPAPGESQRHPTNVVRWELPICKEPVAPGYNPLSLCGCHLALYLEAQRSRGESTMHDKARGGGLVLDFVENRVYVDTIESAEREQAAWAAEKLQLAEARRVRLEELHLEGEVAVAAREAALREAAARVVAAREATVREAAAHEVVDGVVAVEAGGVGQERPEASSMPPPSATTPEALPLGVPPEGAPERAPDAGAASPTPGPPASTTHTGGRAKRVGSAKEPKDKASKARKAKVATSAPDAGAVSVVETSAVAYPAEIGLVQGDGVAVEPDVPKGEGKKGCKVAKSAKGPKVPKAQDPPKRYKPAPPEQEKLF